jgi:hypothetical protein
MKFYGATLAKNGLTIKFIILIETSGSHTYYFKSKLSENIYIYIYKYINWCGQIWIAYFYVIGVKLVKVDYQLLRSYMTI